MSVALFGGSFDPPHFGHKAIVREALKRLDIDRLIVVPTFLNPFKSNSYAPPELRLSMSREFFGEFEGVIVDDYEIREKRATPTGSKLEIFSKAL